MHKRVIAGSAFALLFSLTSLRADDGAASIAAGGIVMKRESRIVMAKEVLRISETKVIVDYDFRNDTDQDVTTEVAFPVPAYSLDWDERSIQEKAFDDFHLLVDGRPANFDIEARAKLGKRDVSDALTKLHIDVKTFGHFNEKTHYAADIRKLSPAQRRSLISLGLIENEDDRDEARWKVEKKYYWSQTFPAHAIVHIRHEYTPVLGNSNTIVGNLVKTGRTTKDEDESELLSVCPTPELLQSLRTDTKQPHHNVGIAYVDFILTTANTWKTPIEDFTLIVERPPRVKDPNHPSTPINLVSFCWDGPVEKIDQDHFQARIAGFVPKKELRVGFLNGYLMDY